MYILVHVHIHTRTCTRIHSHALTHTHVHIQRYLNGLILSIWTQDSQIVIYNLLSQYKKKQKAKNQANKNHNKQIKQQKRNLLLNKASTLTTVDLNMNPSRWLALLYVWTLLRRHLNEVKLFHPAEKAALRTAVQQQPTVQLTCTFLCEMCLDTGHLHHIWVEGHRRAIICVRVPRQLPLNTILTQPLSPKSLTFNRRENQEAMLSAAGIIYRKQPKLKWDAFLLPISSRKLCAPPSLVHNRVLVHGSRIWRLPENTRHEM